MGSNVVSLGDVVDLFSGGTPSKKNHEYWGGDIPWVSAKSMDADSINSGVLYITDKGLASGSRLAEKGTMLFLTRGSGLFSRIPVIWVESPVAFNQDIKCLQAKKPDDARYIYHWLVAQRPVFSKMLDVTGIGAGKINTDQLLDMEIYWPDVLTRQRITQIADPLIHAIHSNSCTNDYLAESIRALFSHWFVDFAPFTGEPYVESEIGRIPSSIRLVPLKDLTKTITKGTTPTTLGYRFTEHGINYIKGESILDDHSFDYSKFAHIDDETNIALKRSIIENRDLLFTIAGTLGRFAMAVPEILPANTNQAVGIIRPDVEKIAPEVLLSYFISGWQNDYYSRRVQQAVQANLSLTTLKSLPVPMLIGERRIEYEDLIVPIVHAIESNNAQNRKLTDLRDTLLPKLMSGEIDMSEIAVF